MLLFFSDNFKPKRGGVAEYVHQLCQHVDGERMVVTTYPGAEGGDAGYPVLRMPWPRFPPRRSFDSIAPLRTLRTHTWRRRLRSSMREFLRERADAGSTRVVIGSWSAVAHSFCRACVDLGIPYAIIAHGSELGRRRTRREVRRRARDLDQAGWVICNSRYTASIAGALGVPERRLAVLTPAVDPASCAPATAQEERGLDARYGLGGRRVILSLGRLVQRKGFDVALRAFAELSNEHPSWTYVIAGEGVERSSLEGLRDELGIANRVVFTGAVSDGARRALYERCSFLVMPSRRLPDGDVEGFGIVFLEAALYCRPSIGGLSGGIGEAIEDGQTGLLVDSSRGHESITRAMRSLMSDDARTRQMGALARERALGSFRWETRAEQLRSLLGEASRA